MRYALLIEYLGTNLYGWQRQSSTPETVQEIIECAIFKFTGENITICGSGRTDSGVHAKCQVAHFDSKRILEPVTIIGAINYHVRPYNIVILSACIVADDFHARFSATKRVYNYHIIQRTPPLIIDMNRAWRIGNKLDTDLMQQACKLFVGKKDFTSFRASLCQAKSPIITLDVCEMNMMENRIIFVLEARSFLHHMVRNIMGTIYEIGTRKKQLCEIEEIFVAKDRSMAGITAPACGLYLTKILYQNYPEINHWIESNL